MLQSQPQIRANFQAINSVFSENHEDLNQEFQGYHNLLDLYKQVSDPVTAADQTAVYTKAVSGNPCVFYAPNSAQTPIQLTYPSISTGKNNAVPPVYLDQQYTFMAGPFVVYGGVIKGAAQNQTITLTPSTTLIYVGLFIRDFKTGAQGPLTFANACATNLSVNTFKIQFTTGLPVQDVFYLAIGK